MLQQFRLEHYYICFMNIVEDSVVTTKSLYSNIDLFIYLFESFFIIVFAIFKSSFPSYTGQNSFYLHASIKGDWKFGNLIKLCLDYSKYLNKAIFKSHPRIPVTFY